MAKNKKSNVIIPIPEHIKNANPEIIDFYKEWYQRREILHKDENRYLQVQDPDNEENKLQIDLLQAIFTVRKVLTRYKLPKDEQQRIIGLWSKIQSEKIKLVNLKKKWETPISWHKDGIKNLDPYIANIVELFGSYKTVEEIRKILYEKYAYDMPLNKLKAIRDKNLDNIKKLQTSWQESVDEYSITHKKGQVERLVYLLNTQLDEYKKNNQFAVLRSKEIRAILEQIWNVIGGNKIILDVNQNINITATINVNQTLRQITQRVAVNSFIVALVAVKNGIEPTKIMHKLENSYFRNFNGFTKEQPTEEMFYPSGLINQYNWDEIKQKHEAGQVEATEVKIIEPVVQPQQIQAKAKLLELMGAKVANLEKNRVIKKEK